MMSSLVTPRRDAQAPRALLRLLRLALVIGTIASAGRAAAADGRRFALVVGANVGDAADVRLRYAEADAERIGQTLRSLGDFPSDQVLLMTGTGADEVRQALGRINLRVREQPGPTFLFVYYSGHADAESLHLAGTRLGTSELRTLVAGSAAASRVLVIDACRSGALTRVKGGRAVEPFQVDADPSPAPEGMAILTSSADGEDSQESDQLRASFFTYHFNSGLLGAADENHDGRVTLAEAFSFAAGATMSATLHTAAGPQHPTYRYDLGGRSELVLTRPRAAAHRHGMLLFRDPGHYVVRRLEPAGPSPPIAELVGRRGGAQVALPPGRYQVTVRGADQIHEGACEVQSGGTTTLSLQQLERVAYARMVRKGAAASADSLVVAAGAHGPMAGFDPGYAAALAWRHDRRLFSLEGRIAYARVAAQNEIAISYENQVATGSALALKAWDFGVATFDVGLELGAVVVVQRMHEPPAPSGRAPRAPWQLPGGTSWGLVAAPAAGVELPLRFGAYVRFEAALPGYLMKTETDELANSRRLFTSFRLLAGVGAYLR